jgi:hypothetical protein
VNWGDGVLTYEGHEYPFSIEGLSIGDVGAAGFTASGTVHDLHRAEDFNGRYTNANDRVTVVAARSAVTLRNENGVIVDLVIATEGAKLAFRLGGFAPRSSERLRRGSCRNRGGARGRRRPPARRRRDPCRERRRACREHRADRAGRRHLRRMRAPRVALKTP